MAGDTSVRRPAPIPPIVAEPARAGPEGRGVIRVSGAATRLAALPPLALYVHIPWCVRKCPYCDFNSHEHPEGSAALPEAAYLDALTADLESALPLVWGRRFHAVFLGGGTPSLLSVAAVDELLSRVRARVPLEADAEVTLEANPGTFEAGKFAGLRAAGVTRLSVGVQSFDDRALAALGRIHGGAEARAALGEAQRVFANFNVDLMYGLPGQTLAELEGDLAAALSFAPTHLSIYQLTIEANTVFAKYPPPVPDDDLTFEMQARVEATTAQAGFTHYEVSAYARPGYESRHNLNYWNFGDYLGIGAGAHSKLSFPDRIVRQVRQRQPATYLARAAEGATLISQNHEVAPAELPFEFMLNALRLVDGFALARFSERTGVGLAEILPVLEEAERRGLIVRDHLRVKPTERGRHFLNDLQALFLPNG